jgi:hypothetical protein
MIKAEKYFVLNRSSFIRVVLLSMIFTVVYSNDSLASVQCSQLFDSQNETASIGHAEHSVIHKIKGPAATHSGWIVTLSNGIKGFFKPINIKIDSQRIKNAYQSPYHEVAAYRISELLGFGVVPETILTQLKVRSKSELGSLQLYVEGKTADQLSEETGQFLYESDLIWLFDKIIANIDRSGGNYIITAEGKMVAIDNSKSFFTNNSLATNLESPKYGPAVREKIVQTLNANPQILINLNKMTKAKLTADLNQLLLPSQINALYQRIQTVVSLMDYTK